MNSMAASVVTRERADTVTISGLRPVIFLVSFMNVAGAQEAAVRVARALQARGIATEVWFLYKETSLYDGDPDIRVILRTDRPGLKGYLKIAWLLYRALKARHPRAVVSFLPLANTLGQTMAWLAGIPTRIASQRGPYPEISRAMRVLDRAVGSMGIYSKVIAVSHAVRESFASLPNRYRRRITVVPNGLVWTPSTRSVAEARQRFGLPTTVPLVVTVGRMKDQKNYPFQLRVLARLPEIHLAIAGDGPLRSALEEQARDLGIAQRIHFLGNVDRPDIPDLLRTADIFILPSLYEGQSNALLEAIHEGLPVIASDLPEQAEVLLESEEDPAGLLLPLDDEALWAQGIAELLGDRMHRERLRRAALRRARAFTLDRMTDGFAGAITGRNGAAVPRANPERTPVAAPWPAIREFLEQHHSPALRFWCAPDADLTQAPSCRDLCDMLFALYLCGCWGELDKTAGRRFTALLRTKRLAGGVNRSDAAPDEPALSVHNSAYALAVLNLFKRHGLDLYPQVVAGDGWNLDALLDRETALPRWPRWLSHHNWRVSHWIGGTASLLLSLEQGAPEAYQRAGAPAARQVAEACDRLIDPTTGTFRLFRSRALQWLFRQAYRLRHDPDLGDIGGVVHIHWVNHALGRPYHGRPVLLERSCNLLERRPFMEGAPYCLDFDVVQIVRTALPDPNLPSTEPTAVPGWLRERALEFQETLESFFANELTETYKLNKLPGALATYHECALLLGQDRLAAFDCPPRDIIRDACWL